ncbi:bifunctional phosphoribosylaminoimidazolecarboxamide formyltransferase/IMP cyclohydrolase [Muribaculum intestinale]|uniref:Bifunctional purine biosynthesis protein PurH n=1 Tax=Muribaculum intestinale TaxID=1796646 RepID=A0A1B1S892_9BACT|nr:bifunctional phosphoribosylaminoimidazolecarboxamide formyltransferase/IMP cyclohydrolase [Muribaculum intestinale]ANU63019.1 bifunctional phosphoribosylaminoimidazolecarboxamide formyltransferase/IMP cyclohydrolase [Muribaculum intestinale]ASB38908.1 bifunctional phosphoribosylaminoimidazolecarboxamide formyltransferase/IMP cyclohydrolase [Muribaculum intestinale]PWB05087.1 bifunctional phosphoribosylaminoimidazolecarboxamide formyltransferase/IMP cyclohydrolase PurH [Muribaculum intestinale
MSDIKNIKTALISVYHKDGLDEILSLLHNDGVKFLSTGGTQTFIESLGYPCDAVEDLTGYPSILGGRVKTLHPKVFGGILNRREHEGDKAQIAQYEIPEIDLVIVDLYPFVDTVASGASNADIIEKIDIGGISLIRAAAKNYNDVIIVASKGQYSPLAEMLRRNGAKSSLDERRWFAKEAFAVSSAYDSSIFNYFDLDGGPSALRVAIDGAKTMRYGENPHQKGFFFGDFEKMFTQLHGKEISYNNLLDIDAAVTLISEFADPTFAVLKHNNACGVATRATILDAWKDALAGDPVSAFGGVLVTNGTIDEATAEEINKIFFEVVIAPAYTDDALKVLQQKKNRIILVQNEPLSTKMSFRSCLNGALGQERDLKIETPDELKCVTNRALIGEQITDLLFANKIVKNSKSNAIVLAKNGQLYASGVGQTSRVDALRQAIAKAQSFGFDLKGAVMASDAFFPFPDCVKIAHEAGIEAVVHPGGSIRDQESVDFCNAHDMAMAVTGFRHFKH